jgi:hypothetical protein
MSPIPASLSAASFAPLSTSAFSAKVALACEVARLRCSSSYSLAFAWQGAIQRNALEAGRRTALEGGDLASPLIDGAEESCEGVRRAFEFGYWKHHPGLDPARFFDVIADGRFVEISSLRVAGGDGVLSLHESDVTPFFRTARSLDLTSYDAWANDPCPEGGRPVLYRYEPFDDDDSMIECDAEGIARYVPGYLTPPPPPHYGMLVIDPDTHPSYGELVIGEPNQELEQLAALGRLEPLVRSLLAAHAPTPADKDAARARAAAINERVNVSFLSESGYCSRCWTDATPSLLERKPDDSITGCPTCQRSWCD